MCLSTEMLPVVVTRSRTVSLPPDVVWQFIEPAESLTHWLPLGDRCELVSGSGLGRQQRLTARWGRQIVEIDQEVVGYEPEGVLAWRHVAERSGSKPAPRLSTDVTVTVRLQAAHPGTRVTLESRSVPASRLASFVLKLVAARRIGRAFDHALESLARAGG